MLRMKGAQGSRWGSLHAAALFSPLTLLPTLIPELSPFIFFMKNQALSAQLSPLVHLCSIRSPFPLTANVFSLLTCTTEPTFHSVLQYCGHPQMFLLYLHIDTARSLKLSNMNKTSIKQNFSQNTAQQIGREIFSPSLLSSQAEKILKG